MTNKRFKVNVEWMFESDAPNIEELSYFYGGMISELLKHWRDEHDGIELNSIHNVRIVFEPYELLKDRLDRQQLLLDDLGVRMTEVEELTTAFAEKLDQYELGAEFIDIATTFWKMFGVQQELTNIIDDEGELHTPFEGETPNDN
jgi:hypothetical protein